MRTGAAIERVRVAAWTIPTDAPESDGTLAWTSTTLIVASIVAGGCSGLGYTYGHRAIGTVINDTLAPLLCGRDALATASLHETMRSALRNIGLPGLGAMALSAMDIALWDLKGRLLDISLPVLLGAGRDRIPVYGSGGFTSADERALQTQLAGWVEQGIARVKMKLGREAECDRARVAAARAAIGAQIGLMVDANGGYARQQARTMAEAFADQGVDWFEEPVSSDDLDGLRWLRSCCPAGVEIAAGEYGWGTDPLARMLAAGAVDVLQIDATRCGGYTGLLAAAALAQAAHVPVSTHCAPALHAPVCVALPDVRHLEWFHDHVRVEALAFEGLATLEAGSLVPARDRAGHGLTLREQDLAPYQV